MNQTPAGWYADPNNSQVQRYWDGSQWTDHTSPGAAQRQQAAPAAAPAAVAVPAPAAIAQPAAALDPYSPAFNLAAIPVEQRELYKQHQLTDFPTWAVVVLSILTLGLFGLIYHGLKHSKLPTIKSDDFGAGKSIGFSFIPFFNLYWLFVNWPRLAERLNFQFRLRGAPDPVSKDLILWANVCWIAGYVVGITWLAAPVLASIAAAQIQTAANKLARGEVGAQAGAAAYIPAAATPVPPAS